MSHSFGIVKYLNYHLQEAACLQLLQTQRVISCGADLEALTRSFIVARDLQKIVISQDDHFQKAKKRDLRTSF